jgi:hypothetical protein
MIPKEERMASSAGRDSRREGDSGRRWWLRAPLALAILALLPASRAIAAAAGAVRRETRPTLDPARFVGKAKVSHQVARDIPDVLDQLYCYCACDKHLGHKSLLSCYTDSHAAT